MAISYPTYKLAPDWRRQKNNGTYPIKLWLTYQRNQQCYRLAYECTKETWAEYEDGKRSKAIAELRNALQPILLKTQRIIEEFEKYGQAFDFKSFEKAFFGESLEPVKERELRYDLFHAFEEYIQQLEKADRASTAISYRDALKSLKKFGGEGIRFDDITPTWLSSYEKSMLAAGRSITTVGIYVRSLRTIINMARERGVLSDKQYPFGRKRYQIPVGRNIKKALNKDDVLAIRAYSAEPGSRRQLARDLWIFSYLANGMNLADILRLKWEDINGDYFTFVRGKTERATRTKPILVTVIITPPLQEIIDRWGNLDRQPDQLIFPIINPSLSGVKKVQARKDLIGNLNSHLQTIGKELKISKPITLYVARHSYATALIRAGASIETVTESLGNSTIQVSRNYIDSLDIETKRTLASSLL